MDEVWAAVRRLAEVEVSGTDPLDAELLGFVRGADRLRPDEKRRPQAPLPTFGLFPTS